MKQHLRNVAPMMSSARCCAKTRTGKPCQAPAVSGKTRCRMHGGARGSGAPKGNQNALRHGDYSGAFLRQIGEARLLARDATKFLRKL